MSNTFVIAWTAALPDSSVHGNSPGKKTEVDCYFLLQGIFLHPGIKPASPALAGGFFTAEPPGKLALFLTYQKLKFSDNYGNY